MNFFTNHNSVFWKRTRNRSSSESKCRNK